MGIAFWDDDGLNPINYIWGLTLQEILAKYGRNFNNAYFRIPSGAKYLSICERNDLANAWTVNKIINKGEKLGSTIELVCWGDSITAGTSGTSYPAQLEQFLDDTFTITNFGVGSGHLVDISARQGGVPALLYEDLNIPADKTEFLIPYKKTYNVYQNEPFPLTTRYDFDKAEASYNPIMIDGVKFNLRFAYEDNILNTYATRLEEGNVFTAKKGTPIYPGSIGKYRDGFCIIFMGTNDTSGYTVNVGEYADTIIKYHDDCIKLLNNSNYLILGMFNINQKRYFRDAESKDSPTDEEFIAQYESYEAKMRQKYGLHFLPLRTILGSEKALDDAVSLGFLTSEQRETNKSTDAADIAKGCVPHSFMTYHGTDYVHPNYIGYQMIAYYVSLYIKRFLNK